MVSNRFKEQLGTVMASIGTVSGVGCMVGPVVGGVLHDMIQDPAWSFRMPFLVCSLAPLALLPTVPYFMPRQLGEIDDEVMFQPSLRFCASLCSMPAHPTSLLPSILPFFPTFLPISLPPSSPYACPPSLLAHSLARPPLSFPPSLLHAHAVVNANVAAGAPPSELCHDNFSPAGPLICRSLRNRRGNPRPHSLLPVFPPPPAPCF